MTGKLSQMNDTINLNIEYCGNCAGTCHSCLLSEDERRSNVPFFTRDSLLRAIDKSRSMLRDSDDFVIGIGRGNVLTLGGSSVPDIRDAVSKAASITKHNSLVVEISTSLVGKIDFHIEQANKLESEIKSACNEASVRFNVVLNPSYIHSKTYISNIKKFFSMRSEMKGGGDMSGDIIIINTSAQSMISVDDVISTCNEFMFPVNVNWIGGSDIAQSPRDILVQMEAWFADAYVKAVQNTNIDLNIINRSRFAFESSSASTMSELIDIASRVRDSIVFIGPDGNPQYGAVTILGDMDHFRFPKINTSNAESDVAFLLSRKECRKCTYIAQCIASGGAVIAINNGQYMNKEDGVCPSSLRSLLARVAEEY